MSVVIFGASGGIGRALLRRYVALEGDGAVYAVSRMAPDVAGAICVEADITSEQSLAHVAEQVKTGGPLSLCIVASGVLSDGDTLQPEKSYRHQSMSAFRKVFEINTFAPGLIAKHMLPLYSKTERGVFAVLSARVGSISDNRLGGWHAYRASKAALNMLVKNYAIEQARRNAQFISVALHPGTVDTDLSKPFQANVADEQLFAADQSAAYLMSVIDGLTPEDSGKVFDWAGKEVLP